MRRRRVIVGLVALALMGAAVFFRSRGPQPCRATFQHVREGMTRGEVIATVGGPPGDYTGGSFAGMVTFRGGIPTLWTADDGELVVYFRRDRVSHAQVIDVTPIPRPPVFDRLRARIGL